jgi:error-prone DNA polymerase
MLPVDINHSDWDALLEGEGAFDKNAVHPRHASMREVIKTRKAVRLGFRLVKGLKQTDMEALVARRGEGYRSVHDLWLRSGLSSAVLERLADADAFRSVGLDRRAALWAVKALDEQSAVERLPLFEGAGSDDLQIEPKVALPEMPAGEQVIHDYRTLTLSLKAHPVSFMREDFSRMGILRSRDLAATATGRWVTVAGLVLVRQRPGSANGVIFMTIEDETGIANIIVWEKTFQKYRRQVMGSRLVKVRGRLQNQSGVIHVVADHLEDITPMLGLLRREARRFGVNDRADEVLRPSADAREKKKLRQLRLGLPARAAPEGEAAAQVAEVMPKGRNFH